LDELLRGEELLPSVRQVKTNVEKIFAALEQQKEIQYDSEKRIVHIETGSGTVDISFSNIPENVYGLLRNFISKSPSINWSLFNNLVKQEELMRVLQTNEEQRLSKEVEVTEQLLKKIKNGEELTAEERKMLQEKEWLPEAVERLVGKADLGTSKSREILKRILKTQEDKKLLEGLTRMMPRKPLSGPVEKLKTLFEQVQYDDDGKPEISEDGTKFILRNGEKFDPSGISKELLDIVSRHFGKGEPIDWEKVDEIYQRQTIAQQRASVIDVLKALPERQEVLESEALQEKERKKKEREEKRKEYWKRFEKFLAKSMRGVREGITQVAEGITKDRETLQFGKTPLPEAFKAVMMTKMPEIRSDVRGAAEALRPYFARQDMLEQSLKLVTTDPYLAGVRLTGPYAGSRGEVSLPELYRAYTELYQINPELMRDPQVAATVLKKYFAADRALDLSEIVALSKNKPYMSKYGQAPKNPLHGRAIPTSVIFGTVGGLTPLIFVRDKKDLPLSMLIGALLGAGMGYFLGNVFDAPV